MGRPWLSRAPTPPSGVSKLWPDGHATSAMPISHSVAVQYPFHMEKDAVEIMAGSDEGVFAWITVNQLLGRFNEGAGKTVSIMDLGGGSTQIVFEPSASSLALAPSTQRYTLKMGSKTYELYQNSYEGYGLNRAREQMYEVAAENADPSSPVQHPCVPTGHQEVCCSRPAPQTSEGGSCTVRACGAMSA